MKKAPFIIPLHFSATKLFSPEMSEEVTIRQTCEELVTFGLYNSDDHQIVREIAAEYNLPIRNPVPISVYKKIKVSSGGGDAAATAKLIVYGMLHPFKAMPMMKKVGVQAFIEQEKLTRELEIKTPDWFVDVFYENATAETFKSILSQLPEGTSEIMCHPGMSENEILILTDSEIKNYLAENNIKLSTFGEF